jgi:hypothetical protein
MIDEEPDGQREPPPDPCSPSIDYALNHGWSMVPSFGFGTWENALIRNADGFTDFVTLPQLGHALVARLSGGPTRDQPRQPAAEWFKHYVPVEVALNWILVDPNTDELLQDWIRTQQDTGPHR